MIDENDVMQEPLPNVLCFDLDPSFMVCTEAAGHAGDHGCWTWDLQEGKIRRTWPKDD